MLRHCFFISNNKPSRGLRKCDKGVTITHCFETYTNGPLHQRGVYEADKRKGLYQRYDTNEQLMEKGTYEAGKKQRLWVWYYKNGQLKKRVFKYGEQILEYLFGAGIQSVRIYGSHEPES